MQKHVFFWIGFFLACLISVVIAVGAWGVAERYALNLAAIFFGFILALTIVLIIVVFFREKIIRKVFQTNQSTIDDVIKNAVKTVSSSVAGDRENAEIHSEKLLKSASSWFLWTNFYRWVITTCVAMVLAFGAFAGTVLLFEQNRKIENQNKSLAQQTTDTRIQTGLQRLTLVSDFRERLFSKKYPLATQIASIVQHKVHNKSKSCTAKINKPLLLYGEPNQSILHSIYSITLMMDDFEKRAEKTPGTKTAIIAALTALLHDDDSSVRVGALQILDKLNSLPDTSVKTPIKLFNVALRKLVLKNTTHLNIYYSSINRLDCPKCETVIVGSAVNVNRVKRIEAYESYLSLAYLNNAQGATAIRISNSILKLGETIDQNNKNTEKVLLKYTLGVKDFSLLLNGGVLRNEIVASVNNNKDTCLMLAAFCHSNDLYKCSGEHAEITPY